MKNKTWIHVPTGQVIVGIPQLTKKGATLVLANGETVFNVAPSDITTKGA